MKKAFWTGLVLIICAATSDAKSWHGITPLISTRSDVEHVLGKPLNVANHWATYQTDSETVSILYSNGLSCGAGANTEWRVPEGFVISITVVPKTVVLFSTLRVDESVYEKKLDPHKLNHIDYWNEKDGESISVTDGEINSFRYTPGSANNQSKCSNNLH